ncbi:MAG: hypothetical protein MHM6MM_005354 [Cercozoa sp. M6MM]
MAVVRMQRQLQLMQTALAVAEEAEKRRQQTTAQIDEAEVHVWLGTMLMKEFGDSNDNSNHTALTSTPAPAQQEAKEIDLDELFGTKDMLAESTTNTPSTIVYRYEDDEYNGADIDAASVSGGSEYEDLKEPVCNQGIPEELNLTPYHCTRRCTLGNFEKPVFPSLEGVHDLPEDYKTAADVSVACPFFTDSEDSVSAENSLTAESSQEAASTQSGFSTCSVSSRSFNTQVSMYDLSSCSQVVIPKLKLVSFCPSFHVYTVLSQSRSSENSLSLDSNFIEFCVKQYSRSRH